MADEIQPQLKQPRYRKTSNQHPLASIWLRGFAFVIDGGILTLAFWALAESAYEALYPVRWTAQVVCFLISFAYFWIGASARCHGRTVGKLVTDIRVMSVSGEPVPWGRAALRAALLQVLLIAYAIRFQRLQLPLESLWQWVGLQLVSVAAVVWTVASLVMAAMHPKRQALHDMLARTVVARVGREEDAALVADEWGAAQKSRLRWASFMAVLAAAVVGGLMVHILIRGIGAQAQRVEIMQAAREVLSPGEGLRLVFVQGPDPQRYEATIAQIRQHHRKRLQEKRKLEQGTGDVQPIPALTTETLQYAPTGRRFMFIFETDDTLTTTELTQSEPYRRILDRVDATAAMLSRDHFTSGTERLPYDGALLGFVEVLPLYLYSRNVPSHHELVALDGPAPPPDQVETLHALKEKLTIPFDQLDTSELDTRDAATTGTRTRDDVTTPALAD